MDQKSPGNVTVDNIIGMEAEYMISALQDKISNLEKENLRLRQLLQENDVIVEGFPTVSDEEYICVLQIKKLRSLADEGIYTTDDAKVLDLLHKNLKLARGEVTMEGKRKKKLGASELLKIVDGEE